MADSSEVSRRRFLQAGALATAAAGLAPIAALARPAAKHGNLVKAHPALDGRWIEPGQEGFAMAAWPNNARWGGVYPGAIAMCLNERDVQRCITWAREDNKTFLIRSGGHNYAAFSTAPKGFVGPDLLIDVKPMNHVDVDWDKQEVTVYGGASNQDVANALRERQYAVPSGRCPTVGTSGLVLGGGWGFAATHSGLTCDSLVGTRIVLADGTAKAINENQNEDLFWAVRGGGGGNFGVHTSFTFKLHKVQNVTTFNIVFRPGKQVELLTKLQSIQNDESIVQKLSTRSKARPMEAGENPPRDRIVVETLGLYWGPESELLEILAPLFKIQGTLSKDIYEVDYWRARDYLLTDDPVGMYQIKNSYVQESLSEDALENMLKWMTRWPGGSLRQDNMGILFAIGGQVKKVGRSDTAYVHRNSNYIYEMEASWSPIDKPLLVAKQRAWLAAYFADMQRYVQHESYVNFPDRELPDWQHRYYGCNLSRLSRVKEKYDPNHVFKFAQSIPLGVREPSCPP